MKDIIIAKMLMEAINATINMMCVAIGLIPMAFYIIVFRPESFYTFLAGLIIIGVISVTIFSISYVTLRPYIWKRILNKIR